MAEKFVPNAKVVDGVLILSLPDALTPVVWQMELGQSRSSALEVREQENSRFVLTLKTPRQDVQDIATYSKRDLAVKALMIISQALEKAQGQIKPVSSETGRNLVTVRQQETSSNVNFWKNFIFKVLKVCAVLGGVALVLFILSLIIFAFISPSGDTASISQNSNLENVPVSADDFLEGR